MTPKAVGVVEVRVSVFFRGGHLVAPYEVPDDPATWDAALVECTRDARARTAAWPFLWLSVYAKGRRILEDRAKGAASDAASLDGKLNGREETAEGDGHGRQDVRFGED